MSGSTGWAALAEPQQALVLAWMPLFRASIVQLVGACNNGAALDGTWQAAISAIVNGLPAGTVIPDTTGLAGAQPLMREDLIAMMGAIESLLASANTSQQRAEYLKVVGPANM